MRRIPGRNRGRRSAALGGLLFAALGGLLGCDAHAPELPDLVLISVDRLAADRLSCFGGPRDAGGSICALADRGTLFGWAVSPGRGEVSSAATVLTGLPEAGHGVGDAGPTFLADQRRSLVEDLSEAGYATAAFVASAPLNRSRRLDQGFDRYDDRFASPTREPTADLAAAVRRWIESAPSPWFVWIHADRAAGLAELDRLLSRLSQTFDDDRGDGPGILFLAFRGEPEDDDPRSDAAALKIGWRTHRIPLVWRPPAGDGPQPIDVSLHLAGLVDVAPTLRAAAGLRDTESAPAEAANPAGAARSQAAATPEPGHDLGRWSLPGLEASRSPERFLLLTSRLPGGEVGLAAPAHLYARRASPLDGLGEPVPTTQLHALEARFAALPEHDPLRDPTPGSARIQPGPWRTDVLDAESPVPRLEFHLARQLRDLDHLQRARKDPQ